MDTTLSDPVIGRLLDGRYEVDRRIARGGMATVYTARDSRLDRVVAVKVMHESIADDPEFVSRFIREARSAARLSHPNIVAVYDQGSDAGVTFLAMEYVDGITLREVLRERGSLPVSETLAIAAQILAALAVAHRAGIIHRDIKPENVLITPDGTVKVADFGLARAITNSSAGSTLTGNVIIGTVAYLSPELVERGVADARSDVYAVGILLFEMLTGRKPYTGDSPIQIAFRHVHESVPAPSTLIPHLSPDIDTLVTRATARNPDDRPHDAGELYDAVRRLREGRPMVLRPMPGPDSTDALDLDADATVRASRTLVVPRTDPSRPHVLVPPRERIPTPSDRHSDVNDGDDADHVFTSTSEDADDDDGATALVGRARTRPPAVRRSRRRGWILFLIVMLLGAMLAVAGYWYAVGRYTATPDVLNRSESQAVAALTAAGLHARTDTTYSETVPTGNVVSTDPEPHADVLSGATVTVYLSLGKERYAVPIVAGKSVAAATAAITKSPLRIATTSQQQFSETVGRGLVIGTDPPGGDTPSLKRDATVTLIVSKGRQPISVPSVVDTSADDATAAITDAGLKVASSEAYSDDVDAGVVISQDPPDGTLFRGDTVTIVVSKGPELFDVPSVIGRDPDAATQVLHDAGFEVEVKRTAVVVLNLVYTQNPEGGEQLPRGATVTITVI